MGVRVRKLAAAVSAAVFGAASFAAAQEFVTTDGVYSTDNPPEYQNFLTASTNAGAVGFLTEDFNSYAGGSDVPIPPDSMLTLPSGIVISYIETGTATDPRIDVSGPFWTGTPPFEGTPAFSATAHEANNRITFTFPSPVVSFGADYDGAVSGTGLLYTTDRGETFSLLQSDLPAGASSFSDVFYGFVATMPFTSLTVIGDPGNASVSEVYMADNFIAGFIPEPASLSLVAVGALALVRRGRRDRQA